MGKRGNPAAEPKAGDKAPDWKGLAGIDDKQHSLADYKDAKIVVVAFITNHCPVAKAYEDRLIAVQNDYKGKGVQVVAVNVNNLPADKLDKMKERAAEKKFPFPYLYDATQAIGLAYGAKVTPHVFVLDKDRKIVYVGAIDDKMNAAEAKNTLSARRARRAVGRQAAAAGRDEGRGLRDSVREEVARRGRKTGHRMNSPYAGG